MDKKFREIVSTFMKVILGISIVCFVLVFTFPDEMPSWVRIIAMIPIGLMLIVLIIISVITIAEKHTKRQAELKAKRSELEAKRYCNENGHDWDLCVCRNCGEKRDEMHDWDGCVCRHCGTKRDADHDWNGCKCRRCGKRRDEGHQWSIVLCERCGGTGYLGTSLSYGDPNYGGQDYLGEPCNCDKPSRIRCGICGAERLNPEDGSFHISTSSTPS